VNWQESAVLVTGGTGSFGKKFIEVMLRDYHPGKLIVFSRDELKQHEMRVGGYDHSSLRYFIGDIRDRDRLHRAMRGVDVVVHAAALKQVPACEYNPGEAVKTNVDGAQNIVDAAVDCGVRRVLALSTDKAVNPVNLYGATKLCAEKLLVQGNSYSGIGGPRFSCSRYGNVVGSRGSVIPIFQRQIAAGGPLTVTHRDMQRYFMTIPEAVQLLLQAAVLGGGGEVFVLDMGRPVRVLDLATALVEMSGLKPGRDIEIVFSGVRPGEKMNEELFLAEEDCRRTQHPKIFAARPEDPIQAETLEGLLLELIALAQHVDGPDDAETMRVLLPQICHYIDQNGYQPALPAPAPAPEAAPSAGVPHLQPNPGGA